jgi:hypothetical protein
VIGRPRPGGFGFAPQRGFERHGVGLSAAASYLGLSVGRLLAQMQAGRTPAQIAKSTDGKSVSGLVDAMAAAQNDELDAAVKDGRLTQAQAERLSANLKARITAMVNGRFGFGHRFGGPADPPASPL